MSDPRSTGSQPQQSPPRPERDLDALVLAAYQYGTPLAEALARRSAEAGNVMGMTVYGIGLGNRGALDEAEEWLERASDAGDPMAMVALASMHLDRGDYDAAERYLIPVAATGNEGARAALAEVRAQRARRGGFGGPRR